MLIRDSFLYFYPSTSLLILPCNKGDKQAEAGGDADGNAKICCLREPSDDRRTYQESEETDARHDGDGNARLHRAELASDAIADRHGRGDAETYEQEAQGGCEEVRQGHVIHKPTTIKAPQVFNTLLGPYFVTKPSARNRPSVIAPIPATYPARMKASSGFTTEEKYTLLQS